MGRGRRVRAAVLVAAAFVVSSFCGSVSSAFADEDDEPHLMLFSGRDVWRSGLYAYGGMVWAPTGFEDDGLLLKILLSGGLYQYFAGNLDQNVIGAEWAATFMPGWRFKRGPVEIKIFFGPEFARHRLWPDDSDNRLRGDTFGMRFAAELWSEPTPLTMIAADASLSSVGSSYSARLAVGYKVFQLFYLGPETQVYGADKYDQLRFGVHITSMKTEDVEWSAALGWAFDTDRHASLYARLGLLLKM
jgi:Cellulose biosynthesis protein BcsS